MSTDEILELELSLLLIKYGEKRVLKSLAKVNGLRASELEANLKRIHQAEKKPTKRKGRDTSKVVEEIINQHPQKTQLLKLLYSRFQSRTFLPQLRDIKRFFNKHSLEPGSLSSRNNSAAKVFKLLANLDEIELKELTQEQDKAQYSALGIISDEIMKQRG